MVSIIGRCTHRIVVLSSLSWFLLSFWYHLSCIRNQLGKWRRVRPWATARYGKTSCALSAWASTNLPPSPFAAAPCFLFGLGDSWRSSQFNVTRQRRRMGQNYYSTWIALALAYVHTLVLCFNINKERLYVVTDHTRIRALAMGVSVNVECACTFFLLTRLSFHVAACRWRQSGWSTFAKSAQSLFSFICRSLCLDRVNSI